MWLPKSFSRNCLLQDHQSHKKCLDASIQHPCQFCDAKFGTFLGLNEHPRRGRCEKRYYCLKCDDQSYFSKYYDFKNHKNVVHAKDDSPKNDFPMQVPTVINYIRMWIVADNYSCKWFHSITSTFISISNQYCSLSCSNLHKSCIGLKYRSDP